MRAGTPSNTGPAFPPQGPFAERASTPGGRQVAPRTIAAMRLATLRLQANTASGDMLVIATEIVSDPSLSNEAIQTEINTLDSVVTAAARGATAVDSRGPVARRLVPQMAAQGARVVPSLAPVTAAVPVTDAGISQVDPHDTAIFE